MSWSWLYDSSICFGVSAPQRTWTIAPAIVVPLLVGALLYAAGLRRLHPRASHLPAVRHGLLFAAGWGILAFAFVSPLHTLSARLFTAHMIDHELMMAVAAPLIGAAAPGPVMLWALPRSWRHATAAGLRCGAIAGMWRYLSRPAMATVLHGVAIWLWHLPGLFEAALDRGMLHYLQHVSFLGTALLFWWVLLPRGMVNRSVLGASVMHFFLTSMHTALLGVLLLFSPRLWYPANTGLVDIWGFTPLEDQQLAGLVMWIPAGLIYGGAGLLAAGLWIRGPRHVSRAALPTTSRLPRGRSA